MPPMEGSEVAAGRQGALHRVRCDVPVANYWTSLRSRLDAISSRR